MSKHTEGPWTVKTKVKPSIIGADGSDVGWAYHDPNAVLMAAAPELLESVICMTAMFYRHVDPAHRDELNALINKAKGEG